MELDLQIVIVGAFRYALDRSTYVVSSTCNVIEAVVEDMPTGQLELIEREINAAIKSESIRMQMDLDRWKQCLEVVSNEIKQRGIKK